MNVTPDTAAHETRLVNSRMRNDLRTRLVRFQGRTWWVVKDPISLKYFQLSEEEYFVLTMLDGHVSLLEIKQNLESRYAPRQATFAELQSLLHLFHRRGLTIADEMGQGQQLIRRRDANRRQILLSKITNPLFIRLRGIDAEPLLNWLYPKTKFVYRRWSFLAGIVLSISAILHVAINAEEVYRKLPSLQEFFVSGNLVWLMIALAVTKMLHELGHGLTCKHFGGECHEIGIALLVFTPCLYCDTSDSWMQPNKWHRVAVGAAGMCVELILASVCTFIWWNTEPGILHYLCLNTMFVCSVSTVLFNGNPLLRYDGYYILSDVLEIPNLWQRSRAALVGTMRQWFLGIPWRGDGITPERHRSLFVAYGICSIVYRWFVLIAILWFLSRALEPYGLQAIGQFGIALSFVGLLLIPLWYSIKFMATPGRTAQLQHGRVTASVIVTLMILFFIAFVPLPHRISAPAYIQPRHAEYVYVEVPGILEEVYVQPGDSVEANQPLAKLTNLELDLRIADLTGQRDKQEIYLENLYRRRVADPSVDAQIPTAQAALDDLNDRLQELVIDQKQLTLVSPISGVVTPSVEVPLPRNSKTELPVWSGQPFDTENRGCYLEQGTQLCLIASSLQMDAVLLVNQSDVDFVKPDQSVAIHLDEYPSQTLRGRVAEVAQLQASDVPRALSHKSGGSITTVTDASGTEHSTTPVCRARTELDDSQQLLPGFRGQAKVQAPGQSLGVRFWRFFSGLVIQR